MGGGRPWIDRGKVVSLLVIDGPLKGKVFPVIKPRVLLGRGETDIVLEDSEISRKHCAVEVRGASALLVDLDSTNGTFVDDQRIETSQLEHMSEFRIGSTVMMFSARAKE
jgi:pSer/pThr/pTyr-binding forkhead associated (FHA) protein